jgi:hypothetical protein
MKAPLPGFDVTAVMLLIIWFRYASREAFALAEHVAPGFGTHVSPRMFGSW